MVQVRPSDEDNGREDEYGSRKKERSPEANSALQLSGRNGRKRANVDTPVEQVIDARNRDIRINDNSFARGKSADGESRGAVLIRNERGDIC